jgi:hypothetical protein
VGEIADTLLGYRSRGEPPPIHAIAVVGNAFRACGGAIEAIGAGAVKISRGSAQALNVKVGDKVAYAALRPEDARTKKEAAESDVEPDTLRWQPMD